MRRKTGKGNIWRRITSFLQRKYLEKEKIFFVRRLKRKRKIREIFGKGENTFCGGKDKNRERNGREYLEKELFWEE